MAVNITELQTSEGIADIVSFANNGTGGVFLSFFVFAIFIIIILALKRYGFEQALLVAAWVSFMISLFFYVGSMVNLFIPLTFLIIGALTAFYVWATS